MDLTIIAVVALVLAVLGALAWAHRAGGAASKAEAGRERAELDAAATAERLDMLTDAARVEMEVSEMAESELEKELAAWSKSPR